MKSNTLQKLPLLLPAILPSCNFIPVHGQLTAATRTCLTPAYRKQSLARGYNLISNAASVATRQRTIIVSKLMASYFPKDF